MCVSLEDQNNRTLFKSSFLGKELYTAITCQSKNKEDQKVTTLASPQSGMPDQTAEPPKSRDTSLELPSRYRLHGLAGLLPAGV